MGAFDKRLLHEVLHIFESRCGMKSGSLSHNWDVVEHLRLMCEAKKEK